MSRDKGYSVDYKSIRKEIELKWPAWKVATYNANFATSAHAKKIIIKNEGIKILESEGE